MKDLKNLFNSVIAYVVDIMEDIDENQSDYSYDIDNIQAEVEDEIGNVDDAIYDLDNQYSRLIEIYKKIEELLDEVTERTNNLREYKDKLETLSGNLQNVSCDADECYHFSLLYEDIVNPLKDDEEQSATEENDEEVDLDVDDLEWKE